uniref:Uncharacterized protein n=1 Tax=Magallana gigas TaxID=29159 RepID=K1R4U2_MAGGI
MAERQIPLKSACCKKSGEGGNSAPNPNPRCYVPVMFTEHGVLCGIRMIPTDSSTNRRTKTMNMTLWREVLL